MTKKDYELIAEAIRVQLTYSPNTLTGGIKLVAIALADDLRVDNPKFDSKKFLTACGLL